MRIFQCAAIALAVLLSGSQVSPAQRGGASRRAAPVLPFEVGKPFPALALPALESGRPVSLADFRGKKIILHIFASW